MQAYIESLESLSKPQLVLLLARKRQEEAEPIAVCGMGCRLPGGIDGPDAFWQALRDGRVVPGETAGPPVDSLGRPRWNVSAPDLAPLAGLLGRGGYVKDVDLFDGGYFGIGDDEGRQMDPQQRLLLLAAVEALADANLARAQLSRQRVGVFTGVSTVEYTFARLRNGVRPESLSPYMATGAALSATAARVAVALGCNGPAVTIDTACSSALVAVHLAGAALRRRECDVALVGVAHLLLSPWTTPVFARTGVLSPTGRGRPFAADADGYVRAEGCGVLVLRRAGDAMAAGDRPYGLVRGSAIYQHGERPSLAGLSGTGQKRVIEEALRRAEVDPGDVQYVEAQANGAKLAGQVELDALAEVYRGRSAKQPPLHVGSCKANLGYLETAAGMASLMKTLLALDRGEIPPQPALDEPDPGIGRSVTVPRKAVAWPAGRRLAGVSAFGFTGTNAHVVLEAAPDRSTVDEAASPAAQPELLVLSAHQPEALQATAARLHGHLSSRAGWTHTGVCRTLALGRDLLAIRYAAMVRDRDEVLAQLATVADGRFGDSPVDTAGLDPAQGWPTRAGLYRLPPNAFACRSYWPEENRWS